MRSWLNSSLSLILVFALLTGLAGCVQPAGSPPASGEPTVYKIGFLAAITGSASFLGEPERDAAAMLQKQLDEQGGIVGPDGIRHSVEILIYDTQGNGDTAITIAKKLIDDDGVVAIAGTTVSPVAMALLPVMQEAQVALISMASSGGIVEPVAERYWIFKTAQSNKHTAPTQVRYAQASGYTRIANFYVNNAYGEDGASAIQDAAREAGLEIILNETFDAADTDMTAQLTKLRASGAEALLVTAIPPAAAILTKQFREMGLTIPIIHNHGVGMRPFIDLCGAAVAEGVVFPMGKMVAPSALPDDDPQKQVLLDFVREYEAFSGKSASTFAGHAWDAIQFVLKGLESLPDGLALQEQRSRLRDTIESIQGFAGTGGVFNVSAQDHVGLSPDDVVMVRITNGDWEFFPPERW